MVVPKIPFFLSLILIIFNSLDLITTIIALSMGLVETNPLFYKMGASNFYLYKILFAIVLVIIALTLSSVTAKYKLTNISIQLSTSILLSGFSIYYAYCVINNIVMIGRVY
jgi:hypothetical protein